MIDLHSHVLPGIDDGPPSVEGSLALAKVAADTGTRTLAATPHVTWDLPNTAATVADGIARLQPELDAAGIPLKIVRGGELAASRARELPEEELLGLRLGGGEWLLVECPLSVAAIGFDTLVYELQARGHRILLAHPERSPALHREPERIGMLVDAGALCSVTASSLTGRFGSAVKRFAFELIEQGLVHDLASDAHDSARRPPGLREHIEEADRELPGLVDHAEWLTVDVPHAILTSAPIPPPPGPPPRQRRRGLFRRAGRSR